MQNPDVPEAIKLLLKKAQNTDAITSDMLKKYKQALEERSSFLPELFYIVGEDNFINLVKYLGGKKVTIPSPEQILKEVKKSDKKEGVN